MNSILSEIVQGFLNRKSTLHSVEWRLKSGVTPASSSSQFSIGVISTATVGPKLDPRPGNVQLGTPPISTIAAGSFSTVCEKTVPERRTMAAVKNNAFATLIPLPPFSFDSKDSHIEFGNANVLVTRLLAAAVRLEAAQTSQACNTRSPAGRCRVASPV